MHTLPHTTTVLRPLFPAGPSRWAGARRELLDFMVQGKINRSRHTDHPAGGSNCLCEVVLEHNLYLCPEYLSFIHCSASLLNINICYLIPIVLPRLLFAQIELNKWTEIPTYLTRSSTVVPCWWTLPVGGSQPATSPSFSAIFITGRPPYASVSHRWQSFSCRHRTRVERSGAARNIRILSVYFSQASEDSSLPVLLPLTVYIVPEQWLLLFPFGHVNHHFPSIFFLHFFQKLTQGISGSVFTGQMSFLSPNQLYQSTEGNTNHLTPSSGLAFSFFIHHRTDDGRGIAVFVCCPVPVPERSGQKWQFTSKMHNKADSTKCACRY